VPAKAGTHNHREQLLSTLTAPIFAATTSCGYGSRICAHSGRRFAPPRVHLSGTTSQTLAERHVDRRFRQLRVEAALIELGDQRTLEVVALFEESDSEG